MLAHETHEITGLDEALSLLEEVRRVAEPIQRGDKPYSFTQEEVETALATAVALSLYMYNEVLKSPLPIWEHRAGMLGPVVGFTKSLVHELTLSKKYEVSPQEKRLYAISVRAIDRFSKNHHNR